MDLERRRSNYARTMLSGLLERTATWLGLDDDWERPRPALGTRDVVLPLVIAAFGLFTLELVRSLAVIDDSLPVWGQWLVVASGAGLLVWRRRWPLVVTTLASLHMFVTGVTAPDIMGQLSLQIVYFVAIFSGVAWARDRRVMAIVVSLIVASMFAWIAWQFVVGSSLDDYLAEAGEEATGTFGPVTATVLYTFIINGLYFGGAVVAGAVSWQGARQRADLTEQTLTIASQAEQLRDQALVEERLRIARELHDVVAHHVSVMGIQAGAARRALGGDRPEAASAAVESLEAIELSARQAVDELNRLVSTLRSPSDAENEAVDGPSTRTTAQLPMLVDEVRGTGRPATFALVGEPVPLGPLVDTTLYRVAREAVTNSLKHAGASAALEVRLRFTPQAVELEVADSGVGARAAARAGASAPGGGLGQVGMRERLAAVGGTLEAGPRSRGGYLVRASVPLVVHESNGDEHSVAEHAS
jgi:signal transduction histidine kinase